MDNSSGTAFGKKHIYMYYMHMKNAIPNNFVCRISTNSFTLCTLVTVHSGAETIGGNTVLLGAK